jgi:sterol desaturase/sphingolipid hydroxylase (fatty acid hydroxylase superfamily)
MWILWIIVTAIVSLIFSDIVGQTVHRIAHDRDMDDNIYRKHMTHHLVRYPPGHFYSETYRSSGMDSFVQYFVIPVLLSATVAYLLLPMYLFITFVGFMGLFALVNDRVHLYFHIKDCWLEKYKWFRRLRALHYLHHRNMKFNYGITTFYIDKLLKTFKKGL